MGWLKQQSKGVRTIIAVVYFFWCLYLGETFGGVMYYVLLIVGILGGIGMVVGETHPKEPPTAAQLEMQTDEWKRKHTPSSSPSNDDA